MMPIEDTCEYRYIGRDFIDVKNYEDREILTIAPEGISYLAGGFSDASFLLRTVLPATNSRYSRWPRLIQQ